MRKHFIGLTLYIRVSHNSNWLCRICSGTQVKNNLWPHEGGSSLLEGLPTTIRPLANTQSIIVSNTLIVFKTWPNEIKTKVTKIVFVILFYIKKFWILFSLIPLELSRPNIYSSVQTTSRFDLNYVWRSKLLPIFYSEIFSKDPNFFLSTMQINFQVFLLFRSYLWPLFCFYFCFEINSFDWVLCNLIGCWDENSLYNAEVRDWEGSYS
jgi:hypothetical protein